MKANNPLEFATETRTIKSKKSSFERQLTLSWKSVSDIFQFENARPYVVISNSRGGKTTLSFDIIMQKAKEAAVIYYVSQTKASGSGEDLAARLPNMVRSECTIENMYKIWQEIKSDHNGYYCSVSDTSGDTNTNKLSTLAAIYNKLVTKAGLQQFDKLWIKNLIAKYADAFTNRVPDTMANTIEAVGVYIAKQYYDSKIKPDTPESQIPALDQERTYVQEAFCLETFIRILVNIMDAYPQSMTDAGNTFTTSEIRVINGFYSEKPKIMLMIDDCSEALISMMKDPTPTMVTGKSAKTKEVWATLLQEITSRARHHDCMVIFFVHNLSMFDATTKDSFGNIVVKPTDISYIERGRSISDSIKDNLCMMANKLQEDKDKNQYAFIYQNVEDDSNVYVTKSKWHSSSEPLELSPILQKYQEAYDAINAMNIEQMNDKSNINVSFESAYKSNDNNEEEDDGDVDDDDEII